MPKLRAPLESMRRELLTANYVERQESWHYLT